MSDPVGVEEICELLFREAEPGCSIREAFTDLLNRSDETDYAFIIEAIAQSDCSSGDWSEALLDFDAWLTENGESRRPLSEMTAYVHCCTMTNAPGIDLPALEVITVELLIEYGFDALSASQK